MSSQELGSPSVSRAPKLVTGQGSARAKPERGGVRCKWKRTFPKVSEPRDSRPKLCEWLERGMTVVGGARLREWTGTQGGVGLRARVRVRIPGSSGEPSRRLLPMPIILRHNQLLQPLVPDPLRKRRDESLGDLDL